MLKWLDNNSLPHAWLSIDQDNNDELLFWRYFCVALEPISPRIAKDTEYVFTSSDLFKSNLHLSILVNRLSENRPDFILVMDDFHLITNPAILDGLYRFIRYMPSNMHLILISRI